MIRKGRMKAVGKDVAASLLTGGSDKPYVFGLTTSLLSRGVLLELIGSDELDLPDFHGKPGLNFHNLRGSQRADVHLLSKIARILLYYGRLIRYAATARPRIFHILWNNKFEFLDRTLLMLYYKLLGKQIVLTVHNVNAGRRDRRDSYFNRLTLRIQYQLSDHIFVHTKKMKREMVESFHVQGQRVTVIPFGINNSVPATNLTAMEAKQKLGLQQHDRAILFFGRITPYKGLEYLITAFHQVIKRDSGYRLIVAGRPDNCEQYWQTIEPLLRVDLEAGRAILRAGFIPDDEVEVYFKAADAFVLPYKDIYQSGVLFLGQKFGLPVLAADVGSLRDDVVDGKTGFLFRPEDHEQLANAIERYFTSNLYESLNTKRQEIRDCAAARHSWDVVADETLRTYARLLGLPDSGGAYNEMSRPSVDLKGVY